MFTRIDLEFQVNPSKSQVNKNKWNSMKFNEIYISSKLQSCSVAITFCFLDPLFARAY